MDADGRYGLALDRAVDTGPFPFALDTNLPHKRPSQINPWMPQ